MTPIKTLFGLSVGDRVKYIANIPEDYSADVHDAEGVITLIHDTTGEFYVKLDGHSITYAFLRYELLRIGESIDNEPFEGILKETQSMTIGQMRNYLINYHSFTEGRDFSITEGYGLKEVFLETKKYAQLVNDLQALDSVTGKFLEEKVRPIRWDLNSEIIHGTCLTLFFQRSDWTFRTQVWYTTMYESVLKYYGVDISDD